MLQAKINIRHFFEITNARIQTFFSPLPIDSLLVGNKVWRAFEEKLAKKLAFFVRKWPALS
jgi:hypothetical protein